LHYFIQFHLHQQLQAARDYAHQQGIIFKGDIPIGINRHGVDAWMAPDLYNMDMQAGAPPDDFAVKGQNWGFPTYNWARMQQDGFQWWKLRFEQMSRYYDAFRIDHILGFFRIWSIPVHAVEGIMGHFVPSIPVHINEFHQRGIWFDHYRYTHPHITDGVLWERFGQDEVLLKPYLISYEDGNYALKPEFATQKLVEDHFAAVGNGSQNDKIKHGLFDLISNVILFEVEGSGGTQFHFRFSMQQTASFRHLFGDTQEKLKDLYVDYFFRRQDEHWKLEALHKLPALKRSTDMLICGEDLGLVPSCVADVMRQLGILSLEIQRMPKDPNREFFHPKDAPYLSVVTPSTHDMSTVRGWWEEDREKIRHFFNNELGQSGEAPYFCEPWVNRAILLQHLYSPAMWAVFQLQDILGISETLRKDDPQAERINVPANPKHYWRYRMHITLEQLLKEQDFNRELHNYIASSGRINP
jgi:4-alpha-glucanotransferase